MDESELIEINEQIAGAEQTADAEFFGRVLADELVFRKASGKVVTKTEFLADLENNKFERESKDIKIVFSKDGNLAMVTLTVRALGSEFRNVRVFERRAALWQCIVWFNTKLA